MNRENMIARVRRALYIQGWSVKTVARERQLPRKTFRTILRTDVDTFSYERGQQPMPAIGLWQGQPKPVLSSNANPRMPRVGLWQGQPEATLSPNANPPMPRIGSWQGKAEQFFCRPTRTSHGDNGWRCSGSSRSGASRDTRAGMTPCAGSPRAGRRAGAR